MERKPLIAGNWKMNLDLDDAVSLVNAIADSISDLPGVDVLVAPPFTAISAVKQVIGNSKILLGAQNMHWEMSGAFTGEITLDNGDIVKHVRLIKGDILNARSNIEDEKLGKILFHLGRLDQRKFTKAMRIQEKDKGRKIGTILLDQGYLTEDQLRLALQLQVKKIILDIFTWKKGSYILKEKDIKQEAEVNISITIPNLIMEGLREIKDDVLMNRFLVNFMFLLQFIQY